jgi:ATP-dependent DNA helicase RecG
MAFKKYIKKFDNISWNDSIKELHKPENIGKL